MVDDEETLGFEHDELPGEERAPAGDPNLGRLIGAYRIESLIARGGMGAVYRARRQKDFDRQVALKLVRPQRLSVGVIQRFAEERQILARLEHPHIARLLDGGTTDDALPYFVMEYVEGKAIDRYCEERRLDVEERLELFRRVCGVVHFAHQNLVVHRDLKPSNILISRDGEPKLLDFGIARILGPESSEGTGRRSMTPAYAAPEQRLGREVTTATDVYSLGVLLYKLLTGRLPREPASEADPDGPAPLHGGDALEPPSRVAERAKGPRAARRLAGDLDAVVARALRHDPAKRYATPLELADDLGRHLEHLPVRAHPDNPWYRFKKAARRYKIALFVGLLLAALATTSTVFWRSAVGERQRAESAQIAAEQAQQKAERVAEFLENLFEQADPDRAKGEAVTLRQALDRGREQLRHDLAEDAEIRAELLAALGTVYNNLGLFAEARELKEEALATRLGADPSDRPELAAALNNLGRLDYDLGELERAEDLFRRAGDMWLRLGNDSDALLASSNLASTLARHGRDDEALELHRRHLERLQDLSDDAETDVQEAGILYGMGGIYRRQGRFDEAEPILRRSLALYTETLGTDHTKTAAVANSLGRVLERRGRLDEARIHFERALDVRRRLLGPDHPLVWGSARNLADVLLQRNDPAAGDLDRAEELLGTARRSMDGAPSVDDRSRARLDSLWGAYLVARGRFAEAEAVLLDAHGVLLDHQGADHDETRRARRRVYELYTAWGRPDAAEPYRKSAESSSS